MLSRELIEADSATTKILSGSMCVKATASGWAHLRILSSRAEYLTSILPTTAINDSALEARVSDLMQSESRFGRLYPSQTAGLLHDMFDYLEKQFEGLRRNPGYGHSKVNGGLYVLDKVREAMSFTNSNQGRTSAQADWLD